MSSFLIAQRITNWAAYVIRTELNMDVYVFTVSKYPYSYYYVNIISTSLPTFFFFRNLDGEENSIDVIWPQYYFGNILFFVVA